MARRFGIILGLTLVLACERRATQLLVVVDTDYRVPEELGAIILVVRDGSDSEVERTAVVVSGMPVSFGVVPPNGDRDEAVVIEVEGRPAADGATLVARRARTRFSPSKTLLLPMFLARSCAGRSCSVGETCTERGCASEDVPVESLTEVIPGDEIMARDAGVDLRKDASTDAEPGADAEADASLDAEADSGPDLDAASGDAAVDAEADAAELDAAEADAAEADAAEADAAEADAAVPDAVVDAGAPDTGIGMDAGPDAGCPAAGSAMIDVTRFCIDATEVTVAQYEAFLATVPSTANQVAVCSWNSSFVPSVWPLPAAAAPYPIIYVDWCDARGYCAWIGKRLCARIGGGAVPYAEFDEETVSEWYATCTNGGVPPLPTYPYGSVYQGDECVGIDYNGIPGSDPMDLPIPAGTAVNCHGPSPPFDQVLDMSGNISEWEDACQGVAGDADLCRHRGGAFYNSMSNLRCVAPASGRRDRTDEGIGFRCCAN